MWDVLSNWLAAMLTRHGEDVFQVVACWAFGWLMGFVGTDYVKRMRRGFNRPRPADIILTTYAVVFGFMGSFFAATILCHAPHDQAGLLAIAAGFTCPIAFGAFMRWAKVHRPEIWLALKVSFPGDDPNATGQF